MNRPKSVDEARSHAPQYLAKAREFADQAADSLAKDAFDAAMLNAIHAGISAADAVTVFIGGKRCTSPDHQRAADLLAATVGPSPEARKEVARLRELLARKHVVEYERRRATRREADDAVKRATRLLRWATSIVDPRRSTSR